MLLAKWVLWPVATKNIAKNHCELAEFPCQPVFKGTGPVDDAPKSASDCRNHARHRREKKTGAIASCIPWVTVARSGAKFIWVSQSCSRPIALHSPCLA